MLSGGSATFAYDKNGNQISKTAVGVTVNYAYDAQNRLISVAGGGINTQYQYDGDGNRISQQVGAGVYQYVNDTSVDLPLVLSETGPDGNIAYLHGVSLISASGANFQQFYHSDALGSTVTVTDGSGALKETYSYDPWGKPISPTDPLGTRNKYKFVGEPTDPNTGLVFLRARYYDPGIARFLSKDPFAGFPIMPQTLNSYSYVENNPVNFVDPSGWSPQHYHQLDPAVMKIYRVPLRLALAAKHPGIPDDFISSDRIILIRSWASVVGYERAIRVAWQREKESRKAEKDNRLHPKREEGGNHRDYELKVQTPTAICGDIA